MREGGEKRKKKNMHTISYKRGREGETERKDVLAAVAMLLIPVCQRRNRNWRRGRRRLAHLQLAAKPPHHHPPRVDLIFFNNFSRLKRQSLEVLTEGRRKQTNKQMLSYRYTTCNLLAFFFFFFFSIIFNKAYSSSTFLFLPFFLRLLSLPPPKRIR